MCIISDVFNNCSRSSNFSDSELLLTKLCMQDGKKFYLPLTFAMDSVEACPIIANDQSLVALLMAGCIELKPATHTAEVTLSGVKFEIKRSGPGHNKCNVIGPELMSKLGLAISYAEDWTLATAHHCLVRIHCWLWCEGLYHGQLWCETCGSSSEYCLELIIHFLSWVQCISCWL